MTEPFTCLACGGGSSRVLYAGCRDLYLRTPFVVDYVVCDRCGLVQQHPVPDDVGAFYREYPVHRARSRLVDGLARLLMRDVYRPVGDLAPGAVLVDFGCGSGSYLEGVRDSGLRLAGFELDADQAQRVAERLGVPVYCDAGRLEEEQAGRVDVVTMHFVLEHLTDLDGTFALVSRLLKPGGELYVVVPDLASWEARVFGRAWHDLDPPRHISFPHADVVHSLARRHGMALAQTRAVAFPNGVAGSLPVVCLGRFSYPAFVASLPAGIVASRLAPTGCRGYRVLRDA